MKPESSHSRCFETEAGVPTLTIEQECGSRMIPYSSFDTAEFDGDRKMLISFSNWIVEIEGEQLDDIWEKFQMLDVKTLRVSHEQQGDDCIISELRLKSSEPEPETESQDF